MKDFLIDPLMNLDSYKNIIKTIEAGVSPIASYGLIDESLSQIIMSLNIYTGRQVLLVTETEQKSRMLYEDIINLSAIDVEIFPQKETFFYDIDLSSDENLNQRLRVISKLSKGEDFIVVASIESLLDKMINPSIFKEFTSTIGGDSIIDIGEFSQRLVFSGYERVATVEGIGQFSIRGGIIDVYPPGAKYPYRIELFDDEIDSIREFDILSQRSLDMVEKIKITPTQEILILEDKKELIIKDIQKDLKAYKNNEKILEKFNNYIEILKENSVLKNKDIITPFIPKEAIGSVIDYFKKEAIVFLQEPQRIEHRYKGLEENRIFKITDLLEAGEVTRRHIDTNWRYDEIIPSIEERQVITNSMILQRQGKFTPKEIFNFSMKSTNNYHSKMDMLVEDLNHYKYRGFKIIILSGTQERGLRLKEAFDDLGFEISFSEERDMEIKSNQAIITPGSIHGGFEYSDLKLIVISDKEIFGAQKKKLKRSKKEKKKESINLGDLEIGSYIVHENHGIGRYEGIEQLDIQGIKKDYLTIRYKNDDKLYIAIDQMNLVQKYIGADTAKPRLNKLNSIEWKNTKARAKKEVEGMAVDLLNLYAKRETQKGYSFSKDTIWQRQFEDLFPYEDTRGQASSSYEIKRDMEKEKPMDRLLCGDVGYGKTEVALRAAFKAIMDGKQVAILVPTTILAQQHYNTMVERFRDFPINIGLLSRFRTPRLQKLTIEALKEGNVDIVVGTHRILSKDIKFKNLGLLIIDEEQRFGVKHKETVKELKTNVDVLTLTATPIPRTLHMSLVGIRDMSVIEDPPEERYPIQTYIVEFNPQMIKDAILKEMARGGQVYFVYNRVQTIDKMANEIRKLVPEANVGIGHGQMGERQLEGVMMDFLEGEYDVLVCTTIIETGLDIPNVNTIIVYDADKMGLSQLYQLRGRVGRTNRMAYGYFTYQTDKVLTEVAEKRLHAIKEFTEFGSGFKIAMRDLEIRGSGNLLGLQQSGHIEAIGYDLYVKFLGAAIRRLKGEKVEEEIETTVDIKIDSFIPSKFIEDEEIKIEVYKKIAVIEDQEDYSELLDELIDRFGDIPRQIENLMDISLIKSIANKNKIKNIIQIDDIVRFDLLSNRDLDLELINDLSIKYGRALTFSLSNSPFIELKIKKDVLKTVKIILDRINHFNKEKTNV
nr:transcription-repair coupling factor [Tissierella sp.]